MPRDLADVLHYFMPELAPDAEPGSERRFPPPEPVAPIQPGRPGVLPIVAVPLGCQDIVRASLTWDLVVEIARLGGHATLVTPNQAGPSHLLPDAPHTSEGAEVEKVEATNLQEFHQAALACSLTLESSTRDGRMVILGTPSSWLEDASGAGAIFGSLLLFTSPDTRDLVATYRTLKSVLAANPGARVGIAVHGARSLRDAEMAFSTLAENAERHLGQTLISYGPLIEDLDVYRAIVARDALGLLHPQSPAARAVRDIARKLLDGVRTASAA